MNVHVQERVQASAVAKAESMGTAKVRSLVSSREVIGASAAASVDDADLSTVLLLMEMA